MGHLEKARQYEDDVLSGAVPACKWVRLAVERNRADMKRSATTDWPYRFDENKGAAICRGAERFPHIKGPKAVVVGRDEQGRSLWQTIQLEPWQCWMLSTIYGWVRKDNGLRRFKVVLVLVPRKNAKSTIGAVTINYALTGDGEGGAEVYSAATTRDQAKVSAEIAWEMAKRAHGFRDYCGVKIGAKTTRTLEVPDTASRFMPLSADANSLDGLNVSFALIDELHAHKTPDVWHVLETATGARAQPLMFAITTAGSDTSGICYQKLEYLKDILNGSVVDDEFFGVNYTIDDGDRWDVESSWRKANPNYGVSVNPDDLRRKANEAAHSPGNKSNFLTKHLNVWTQADTPWLSMDGWRAGQSGTQASLAAALEGRPCWVGVDLASKIDLAAVVAAFPPIDGGPWSLLRWVWTPKATLVDRSHRDRAAYDVWASQGHLIAVEGTEIDHGLIREVLVGLRDRYDVRKVGFDPWHVAQIKRDLVAHDGFDEMRLVDVPQTFAGLSSAASDLEAAVLAGRVNAGGCPVMAWTFGNAVVQRDGKDNIAPVKKRSRGRIDPVVATCIAIATWKREPAEANEVRLWAI